MVYEYPAVVVGGEHNGLGVIRNLGRMGIDVYCLVNNNRNFAIYSKYCKGYTVVPGVETDFFVLKQYLQTLEKRFVDQVYLHLVGDLSVLNLATMFDRQMVS